MEMQRHYHNNLIKIIQKTDLKVQIYSKMFQESL